MGIFGGWNDPDRQARARLEAASKVSERQFAADADGKPAKAPPMRYKLYDRIAGRVSVSTMHVIIGAVVVLLIAALVIGIATGSPQ